MAVGGGSPPARFSIECDDTRTCPYCIQVKGKEMNGKRGKLIRTLAIVLVLAVLVVPGMGVWARQPAAGVSDAQPDGVLFKVDTDQNRDPEKIWPLERRAAAEPLAWHPLTVDEAADAAPAGVPGFQPGAAPDANALREARKANPALWKEIDKFLADDQASAFIEGGAAAPEGTAAIYDTWMGNKWGDFWFKYPHVAVGKLYIDDGGYCSASVFSDKDYSPGYDIVVTAAHCVWDGGWYSGWVFNPADRKGVAPFGLFDWAWATVVPNWQGTGSTRYDVAIIGLDKNSSNQEVTYYTGLLGAAWNWDYTQHLLATGYPSNLSGGGLWTHICAAETFNGGTDVLGMGCDMTFGSSGGPWIWRYEYRIQGYNYVMSVVSGGTPGTETFYGARFSNDNLIEACNIIGGCW